MISPRSTTIAAVLATLALGGVAWAVCPAEDETLRRVELLALDRSSRATRFESATPAALYRKAAHKIGRPFVQRDGKRGFGIMVADMPLERFWRAINDEDRHAGYARVNASEIVGGTARGTSRVVFQYAKMFGLGRWWVSRVTMNDRLYRESAGALWEFWWEDDFAAADTSQPPVAEVAGKLAPIERTRGSWLLASLNEGCTLVELFSWSEVGGSLGGLEGLAIERSLRSTLRGMQRLAGEDPGREERDPPFVRPDGSPLEATPASGAAK